MPGASFQEQASLLPGAVQRARLAPQRLTPAAVKTLQRAVGNQAVTQVIQRAPVIQRLPVKLGSPLEPTKLRQGPNAKSGTVTGALPKQTTALKSLDQAPVKDTKKPGTWWSHVEVMSGPQRGTQGYIHDDKYFKAGQKDDTELGFITQTTALRGVEDKRSGSKGRLTENTLVELLSGTPSRGYFEVKALSGETFGQTGFVSEGKMVRASLPINLKGSKGTDNKSKSIIGKEKAGSLESRKETEKALHAGPEEVVEQIVEAFSSGKSKLTAFQRISFLLAGQPSAPVLDAFQKRTGVDLKDTIKKVFDGDPGPQADTYLLDMLAHDGIPSLEARMHVAMGQVDNKVMKKRELKERLEGKLSGNTDKARVDELIRNSSPEERKRLYSNAQLMRDLEKLDKFTYRRLSLFIDVDIAKEKIEEKEKNKDTVTEEDKQRLAEARDGLLARYIHDATKLVPGGETLQEKLGVTIAYKFDTKKFYDDLVDWKSTATPEDLLYVKRGSSKTQQALKNAPTNFLMGLRGKERTFIAGLLDQVDESGGDTHVKAVLGGLKRQKEIVHRGQGGRGPLGSLIAKTITDKKWGDLEAEIKLLDAEQREQILEEYAPGDKRNAIDLLSQDLFTAGFDKEARARILAMFNTTKFGEAGGNYVDLWETVNPGWKTRQIRKLPKQKDIDKACLKIISELEDEEYAQVRQDKALLTRIKAECKKPETWERIMALLGMKDENDQLKTDGVESRVTIQQAKEAAELSPKHWAVLLDKAVEEDTIGEGVSAGREKSAVFEIASKVQRAARQYAELNTQKVDDPDAMKQRVENAIKWFGQDVLNELEMLDKGQSRKVDYLKKRVPDAYAALVENKTITVETKLARAHHEGFAIFGIESTRVGDRQKIAWSFLNLEGRQLLDEWSNLHEFRDMYQELKQAGHNVTAYSEMLAGIPEKPSESERAKADLARTQLQKATDTVARLQPLMKQFTLGIKRERQRDLKAMNLNAENRIAMEAQVTEKLTKAMKDDVEVQDALAEVNLPFDDYMRQKMKAVDALQVQRLLDTTRQWSAFSNLGSQLDDSTRMVKGGITSTESKLGKAQQEGKSKDDIEKIRKEGAKQTEEALSDRTLVEARFRDMQETFKQRAILLFKVIALAIVTGLTMGVGAPLAIGIQVGIETGLQAMEAAFKYFVLGETDVKRLAFDFAIGMLGATTRILTANLSFALQTEMLNSGTFFGDAVPWLAKPIATTVAGVINDTVMLYPKHVVDRYFQEKELEKVIKEGENDIVDRVVDTGLKRLQGFVTKVAGGFGKYLSQTTTELVTGEQTPQQPRDTRTFGQVYTDRLAGGRAPNPDQPNAPNEQEQMWARYEKQKLREVKQQAKKAIKGSDKNTKEAEKEARKDWAKELRGKEEKSAGYKKVNEKVEENRAAFRSDPEGSLRAMIEAGTLTPFQLVGIDGDERGKLEEVLQLRAGDFDALVMKVAGKSRGRRRGAPLIGSRGGTP